MNYCLESLSGSIRNDIFSRHHDQVDWLLVVLVAFSAVIVWKKYMHVQHQRKNHYYRRVTLQ